MAELLVNSVIPITGGSYNLATPTSPGVLYVEVASIPGEFVSLTSSGYDTNLSTYYDSSGTLIYRAEIPYYQSTPISVSISGASEVYYGTSTYYTPTSYPSGSYVSADPPPPIGSNDYQAWYDRNFPEEPEAPPTPSLSTVIGTVKDQNGNPLEATIICRNRSTDAVVGSTTSDPVTGEYSVGCYTINEHYLIAIYNESQVKIKDRVISDGSNNAWDFSGVEIEGFLTALPHPFAAFVRSGFYIDPSGTRLFVGRRYSSEGGSIFLVEFGFLTPWEVDTIYYVGYWASGVVAAGTDEPAFTFSPDGTRMYFANPLSGNGDIYQYNLSVAWDLSTISSTTKRLDGRYTTDDNFRNLQISPDGKHIICSETIYPDHYELSTAWELPVGGGNPTPDSLIGPSFTYQLYNSFFIGNNPICYYSYSIYSYDFISQVGLNTAWDLGDGGYLLGDDERIRLPFMSAICTIMVDPTGYKGVAVNTVGTLTSFTLDTAFDLSTIQLKQKTLLMENRTGEIYTIFFKSDGTKCLIAAYDEGDDSYDIIFYNVSTPWNIDTAVEYGRLTQAVSGILLNSANQFFTPDNGYTFYIAFYNDVLKINFSSAWDPTSYTGKQYQGQDDLDKVYGIAFNADGTRVALSGRNQDLRQYELNTPYDVSDPVEGSYATLTGRSYNDGYDMSIYFANNGRTFFVCIEEYSTSARDAHHTLDKYTLSTPYDLTTASYDGYTILPYRNGDHYGNICISPDGKHMYACFGMGVIQFDV